MRWNHSVLSWLVATVEVLYLNFLLDSTTTFIFHEQILQPLECHKNLPFFWTRNDWVRLKVNTVPRRHSSPLRLSEYCNNNQVASKQLKFQISSATNTCALLLLSFNLIDGSSRSLQWCMISPSTIKAFDPCFAVCYAYSWYSCVLSRIQIDERHLACLIHHMVWK